MAITRERKEELVAKYTDILTRSDGFVIVETSGLTVKQVQDFRARLREADAQYLVTKTTLFRIALQQAGWPVPDELMGGPISVAFGKGNLPGIAKIVLNYVKELEEEKVKVRGGVMAGSVLSGRDVQTVSSLPSLDELRAQILGLFVQPATGLVTVLNAATGQIVNVVHAYVEQKGGSAA